MDEQTRALEQRFRATGSEADEEAWVRGLIRSDAQLSWEQYERLCARETGRELASRYLVARVASGALSEDRLSVAAYADHLPASLALGEEAPPTRDFLTWMRCLSQRGIPESELNEAAGRLCALLLATWIARHVAEGAFLRSALPGLWACWEFLPAARVERELEALRGPRLEAPGPAGLAPAAGVEAWLPGALGLRERLEGLALWALVGGQSLVAAARAAEDFARFHDLDLDRAAEAIKPLLARWALRMDPVVAWHVPWEL